MREILGNGLMDRLTWHNGEYWTQVQRVEVGYKDICAKLAAFEDTGLTPDACAEYKKFEDECITRGVPFARVLELIQQEESGGWISVEDGLPEDGVVNTHTMDYQEYMCIYTPRDGVRDVRPIAYADGKWLQHGSDVTRNISHWMDNPPLPKPPRGDKL